MAVEDLIGTGFPSKEDLRLCLKEYFSQQNVFLTVKNRSASSLTLKCDRGGEYKSTATKRTSRTRLTGCTFVVYCSSKNQVWRVIRIEGTHNHPLDSDAIGHSVARRLTSEQ